MTLSVPRHVQHLDLGDPAPGHLRLSEARPNRLDFAGIEAGQRIGAGSGDDATLMPAAYSSTCSIPPRPPPVTASGTDRSIQPDDKALIAAGLARMSEESRYRRFMAPKPGFTSAELAYLTEIDHHDHEALVAIDPSSGEAVGVARYVRLPEEPRVAEPAVAVIDDWQGLGLGSELLQRLIARAREEGVERFRAVVMRENRPMLNMLERTPVGGPGDRRVGNRGRARVRAGKRAHLRGLFDALKAAARGDLTFRMRGR